jgi:hypothetical protein
MKLKVNEVLVTLTGEKLFDVIGGERKDITLKTVCVEAILKPNDADTQVSGMEKMNRWDLAQKIFKATDDIDITAEEAALLKTLIARAFPVIIAGQSCKMIG